jgi:hypothetical protein
MLVTREVIALPSNFQHAPYTPVGKSFPKFLVKSAGRSHTGAMGDANLFNLHLLEKFDRFLQLLGGQEI